MLPPSQSDDASNTTVRQVCRRYTAGSGWQQQLTNKLISNSEYDRDPSSISSSRLDFSIGASLQPYSSDVRYLICKSWRQHQGKNLAQNLNHLQNPFSSRPCSAWLAVCGSLSSSATTHLHAPRLTLIRAPSAHEGGLFQHEEAGKSFLRSKQRAAH